MYSILKYIFSFLGFKIKNPKKNEKIKITREKIMQNKYNFGTKSKAQLGTCHKDIQTILNELIKFYDFSVLEGIRTAERQMKLFKEGRSKLDGVTIKSKHQNDLGISHAVDIMPYHKGTNAFSGNKKDLARFYNMMGMVKAIHFKLQEEGKINCKIRFGIDWDGDDTFRDQNFDDAPHFEIVPLG